MAADKKGMDEISPLGESTDSGEEKVISVRIPKKTEDTKETEPVETPKEEAKVEAAAPAPEATTDEESEATEEKTSMAEEKPAEEKEEMKEEKPAESAPETSETKPAETASEGVSSFSLLDAHDGKEGDKKEMPAESAPAETSSEGDEAKDSIQKWLDDSDDEPPQEEGGKKKWLVIAFVLVILVGAIGGGVYYYQTQIAGEEAVVVETEPTTMVPTATPAPTEAPEEVDLTEYSVQVLNGTGTAGEATKVANLLEAAGFETPDTGNGPNYNFTDTEVQMIDGTPEAVYESIVKALGDDYSVVMGDEPLEDDADYDVVVTFGSSGPSADTTDEDTTEEGI